MNHKRGKPKSGRAGCLMCKPNKHQAANKLKLGHRGFGPIRARIHANTDLKG
jgi:hypothetical protein